MSAHHLWTLITVLLALRTHAHTRCVFGRLAIIILTRDSNFRIILPHDAIRNTLRQIVRPSVCRFEVS